MGNINEFDCPGIADAFRCIAEVSHLSANSDNMAFFTVGFVKDMISACSVSISLRERDNCCFAKAVDCFDKNWDDKVFDHSCQSPSSEQMLRTPFCPPGLIVEPKGLSQSMGLPFSPSTVFMAFRASNLLPVSFLLELNLTSTPSGRFLL